MVLPGINVYRFLVSFSISINQWYSLAWTPGCPDGGLVVSECVSAEMIAEY